MAVVWANFRKRRLPSVDLEPAIRQRDQYLTDSRRYKSNTLQPKYRPSGFNSHGFSIDVSAVHNHKSALPVSVVDIRSILPEELPKDPQDFTVVVELYS